jgi:hypothetical protein
MRMDVVHRDICTFVLTKPLAFYAGLDRERCSRYAIQFRSCGVWRLPLRRAPALKLRPSHEPGKWGHTTINRLNWPCTAHWSSLTRILFLLKVSAGWPPRFPPQRARDIPSRPVLRFRPNPTPGPAGGLPQPQPGTRPSGGPSPRRGTHFPEHNQVWHDRVGRGPNHRLP